MKLALVQINSLVGDFEGNAQKIIRAIHKAQKACVDLVCFHEMALWGYPPRDLLELPYLIEASNKALQQIVHQVTSCSVLLGTACLHHSPKGKPLYNAAVWIERGKIRQVIPKRLLPTYDVFDEVRYFEAGTVSAPIRIGEHLVGVTLCEDVWTTHTSLYKEDPVLDLVAQGAQVIVNLSASPYTLDKYEQRESLMRRHATRHGVNVVYVNQVGGNDELIFDGGSFVMNHQGHLVARLPFFKEAFQIVDLKAPAQVLPPLNPMAHLEQALVMGLRDYVHKCGFKKVALGLSGGIDSALVAFLAVKALGAKSVTGLIMPSRYSSKHSQQDAKKLAKNLGMAIKTIPVDSLHREYEKQFLKLFGKTRPDTTEENIQARIRGNLLMAFSNKTGALVLSTGNKSELAVGYCTLYGDMSGGLAVISDLPKTLVYQLCHYINRRYEIIPENIFIKAPSAELRENQTDQDTLPAYDILDSILKLMIEDCLSETEIMDLGYDARVVLQIGRLVRMNEYKRRQAAPGLKVTSKAFGVGRRFPLACKF